jgi:hypothetical protein
MVYWESATPVKAPDAGSIQPLPETFKNGFTPSSITYSITIPVDMITHPSYVETDKNGE